MKYLLTFTLTMLLGVTALAHSVQEIEKELVSLHKEIEKHSSYSGGYSEGRMENLSKANKAFRARLLALTAQHASLLNYSFPVLNESMMIKGSSDGHLKVYSWDTLDGGTMHSYDVVYQYRGVEGVYSALSFYDEGDVGAFVTNVFDLETKTGTVYLINMRSRLSTSYNGQSITAFQIDGNSLSDNVKVFKTRSGLTSSIGFGYDLFYMLDSNQDPRELFKFDRKSKTLSFPVVIEDEKTPQGRVTSSKIKYRFDGEHFVRVKN